MAESQRFVSRAVLRAFAFALALEVCFVAGPSAARAPALSLGEVSMVSDAPAHYKQLLVDTLNAELASAQADGPRSFVVNARLALLRTEGNRPVTSSCTVSLVLTERAGGAIVAMAEGRVRVEERAAERAEAVAIQTAARTAMKRVSSALVARR